MFKLFIASTLILAATLPASAEVGPGMGRTTRKASRIQNSAQVCSNDTKASLSLRVGPGHNYQAIRGIPNGEEVALISAEYGQDGAWWWHISYKNRPGWARADFLCDS
jgi:uncharacterized protein YraI